MINRVVFFTFMALCLPFHQILAAQMAIVTNQKAIIYADQSLNSPIGFVRNGRRLMVGSVARGKGSVVPVVVSGRIAYIQLKDIALSNMAQEAIQRSGEQSRQLEHIVEENVVDSTFSYDLTENNYIIFGPGIISPGSALSDFNDQENVTTQNLSKWSLSIEHRPLISDFSFNVGLSYFTLSQSNFSLQSLSAHATFNYNLLNLNLLSLGPMAGLYVSGDFRFETPDEASRGALFGYKIGGQARIAPKQKIGAAFEAGLQFLSPIEMESERVDISRIGGPFVSAALVFSL